jgi:hypothetical protein
MTQPDLEPYRHHVLDLYRRSPDTRGRCRSADRRLAATLHQRGVPLSIVRAALILAAARRRARPTDAQPLPPIASLHYFLPVIEELLADPPDPRYIELLTSRLQKAAASTPPGAAHRVS